MRRPHTEHLRKKHRWKDRLYEVADGHYLLALTEEELILVLDGLASLDGPSGGSDESARELFENMKKAQRDAD